MDRERRNLIFAHQEWLGFVQPVGLVVSPTVMVDAQVVPDRNIAGRQREFRDLLEEDGSGATVRWRAPDLRRLFIDWLGWEEGDLAPSGDHRDALEIALPELQTVLAPTWAVPAEHGRNNGWIMLIRVEDGASDLDKPPDDARGWNATHHARFERLLRETDVPVGLLCTDERVRLVYAPKGETSGHATFEFSQMALPAGRPILAAFEMLLSGGALFNAPPNAALPALLARSREAQAEVSTRLSRQVLAALHELLRGFVASDARGGGTVELARRDPEHLYGGLITTLMRLVFVLYAEDRSLMPNQTVYQQNYSLAGLFARLRTDAAAWPDTMDQRFGAWAQLLSLFRLVHGGGGHGGFSFVARKGTLFDPDRFPFLEGRNPEGHREIPMVPDATVWNVLQSLMILDGERLSYRTLDVEQIGSVYEAIMGFRVERTTGRSIAVASPKRTGAAAVVDLDKLLGLERGKRAKALQDNTDRKLTGNALATIRDASSVADLVAALDRVIDRDATPDFVPPDTPILQPTDERRRSGSHYTPRSLTEPIVSEALRPIFDRLGPEARPEQILDLKVLDPTTGSGAFLVEACRQLAARLVEAWARHGGPPDLAVDMDELLHARRLVAQRCLYGVDRNPMAIDLARLSLWLATLARDHEFTFVDHSLRSGDSLVGLEIPRIEALGWKPNHETGAPGLLRGIVKARLAKVTEERQSIREAVAELSEEELRPMLNRARGALSDPRLMGDAVIAAFFAADRPKDREKERMKVCEAAESLGLGWQERLRSVLARLRTDGRDITPFHWSIEFPEVFERENPGFDAIVGNPPFLGGKRISTVLGQTYRDWLSALHRESNSNSDLVAHFYRRAFDLLRKGGCLGLIATNTIGQGDTRATGLRWICTNGGDIYRAQRRLKWPGEAAVVVSVVHIAKGADVSKYVLDGQVTDGITAFLFHDGDHDDPERLSENAGKSYVGMFLRGMGFTFDDTDKKGVATPRVEMEQLIAKNPRNRKVIFPYIGGEEVNNSPTHAHHRYVINFRDWPQCRADLGITWRNATDEKRAEWRRVGLVPLDYPGEAAADYPDMLLIVESRVRPYRERLGQTAIDRTHKARWWLFANDRPELQRAIDGLGRALVISEVGQHMAFAFVQCRMVFSHTLKIFPFDTYAAFCALQSRPHEIWARFFGSSMKDDLRYTPSDCFETFPFPEDWETHPVLEEAGKAYYEFRAALMVENDEGLTKTYNRFHDPEERNPRILELRRLHSAMDRTVLDAFGWTDIPTDCEFLLDYEIDEETWGRKKKPWRYRWPDAVRDEVLARLLSLNAERAAEERTAGS